MKAQIIGIIVLIVLFLIWFYLGGLGLFWFRAWAVVFIVFGFILSFLLGDTLSGTSGGAVALGVMLLVAGILMLIGSAFL